MEVEALNSGKSRAAYVVEYETQSLPDSLLLGLVSVLPVCVL
jgi:hypothetical protein